MRIKPLLVCSLAFMCTIYPSVKSYATSPYLSYGDKNGRVSININSKDSTYSWSSIASESIAAWNNSAANVYITVNSDSDNEMIMSDYSDSWYGLNRSLANSSNYITQFTIFVNGRTIIEKATNQHNFIKSTITHEFGHTFWLCDNPVSSNTSIMKYSRNRNEMTNPQQCDINNVNAIYYK